MQGKILEVLPFSAIVAQFSDHRRLRIFAHAIKCKLPVVCVKCGREGTQFVLTQWRDKSLHRDVYSADNVLLTARQVIFMPGVKSEQNPVENFEIHCEACQAEEQRAAAIKPKEAGNN